MANRKLYILGCLLLFAMNAEAQDIHFSQLSQTPLLINPASTGVYDGYYRGILNYKDQWAAMGKPYRTFLGSFDMPFYNKRKPQGAYVGLGTYVFSDKAGDANYSTTQGDVSLSCIVPVGIFHQVSAGIEAGMTYRSVDMTAIQWPNQYNGINYDPGLPSNENNNRGKFYYFDMGAGIHYQYLKPMSRFYGRNLVHFTMGAAMFHAAKLFESRNGSNSKLLYPRIVIHSNLRYDIKGTKIGLVPSILYMKQGPSYEFDMGLLLRFRTKKETNYTGFATESAFTLGAIYRYKDAIIPQLFFEIANFGIGLSYDISLSSFSSAVKYNGGLELSIRYSKMKGALNKNWR